MQIPYLAGREGYIVNQTYANRKIRIETTKKEIQNIKRKAHDVVDYYLRNNICFDLFLATSFGELKDFEKAELILKEIQKKLPNLKIFSPALCGILQNASPEDMANEKGDIERWVMMNCRAFWGTEIEIGAWGKYSEATLSLLEHKPAIFVMKESKLKIFKERHPIKLVGHPMASHGYHAVTNLDDGILCLKSELEGDIKLKRYLCINNHAVRSENFRCQHCGSTIKRSATWLKQHYRNADEVRQKLILNKVRIFRDEDEKKKK